MISVFGRCKIGFRIKLNEGIWKREQAEIGNLRLISFLTQFPPCLLTHLHDGRDMNIFIILSRLTKPVNGYNNMHDSTDVWVTLGTWFLILNHQSISWVL